MRQYSILLTLASCFSLLAMPSFASESTDQMLVKANQSITQINTPDLHALLEQQPGTVVIDLRTQDEILDSPGMIDAARIYNVPRGVLEFSIEDIEISSDQNIVVYCSDNQRSPLAAQTLSLMGYANVLNYSDSVQGWYDAGYPLESLDKAHNSLLYSLPVKVTDGVWSAIGAVEPASYENGGHNNNLSFIVTSAGVVVINAGENYRLAEALHHEIKGITDQPVKWVVLENGQGHAAGGSAYWKKLGVPIIAHEDAAEEWQSGGEAITERIKARMRDQAFGTEYVMPDETFTGNHIIELGDTRIELRTLGPAHSPGDISVWLPEKNTVIAGDIAFHQRMLPIFEDTDTKAWLETWEVLEALAPEFVVPGHGEPTNMEEVRTYTKGYLTYMREKIGELLDEGGLLVDVENIDQTAYMHLDTYDELHRLNASRMFRQMEFEF